MQKDINLWKTIKGKTKFFEKHAYKEEHDIETNIRISFVHFISQKKPKKKLKTRNLIVYFLFDIGPRE